MPATADLDAIVRAIDELARTSVLVGIPQERDPRDDGSPVGNAAIMYFHEMGVPENNLPARPVMVPGVEAVLPEITAGMENAGCAAANGDSYLAEQTLMAVGQVAVNGMITRISSNIPPPLKPATIRARRRRSPGSTYRRKAQTMADVIALISTGQLRRAFTYVLRKA